MSEEKQPRILILEDEKNLGLTLVERLQKEGFFVDWVQLLSEAKTRLQSQAYDLAVLDVGLPDGSGFDLASWLRKEQPRIGILFLTAFGNAEDRIRGLELGAEDYVVKPFHLKELILRIQNALKRTQAFRLESSRIPTEGVRIGKAVVFFQRFEAEVEGQVMTLTHKEVALLQLLNERRGEVVSRDEILNHAWSEDEYPTPRTVDNFIMRIRRWVELDPEHPQVIRSIRGIGYQLL